MNITGRVHALFHRFVLRRKSTSFVVLGLSFVGFGIGTLSLATVLKANIDLVFEYGWQALMDGAAMQLIELLVNGYLAMACYVVFKACEHRLVHALAERD